MFYGNVCSHWKVRMIPTRLFQKYNGQVVLGVDLSQGIKFITLQSIIEDYSVFMGQSGQITLYFNHRQSFEIKHHNSLSIQEIKPVADWLKLRLRSKKKFVITNVRRNFYTIDNMYYNLQDNTAVQNESFKPSVAAIVDRVVVRAST